MLPPALIALCLLASPDALLGEARTAEAAGNESQALALLSQAVDADPADGLARLELGRLLLKTGAPEKAWPHLEAAHAALPHNPRAQYFFALGAQDQGRSDDALRALQEAVQLRADLADAQYRLGTALASRGDYARAADAFRAYVERHPDEVGARLELAAALGRCGHEGEAEQQLRALAAKPATKAVASRRLADFLEQHGRASEAKALRASLDGPKRALRPLGPSHQ